VTVVCSSEVLCFYCHWLCSTDIAVGLMFKTQQNESPYDKSVTVTGTVFTKRSFAGQLLVKTAIANFMKILQTILSPMFCDRRTDSWVWSAGNTLSWKEPNTNALT
jgi:hypothetical protein